MDLWVKIGMAALIVAMLVMLIPRIGPMVKNAPKGTREQWLGVGIILVFVLGFVAFLISMV